MGSAEGSRSEADLAAAAAAAPSPAHTPGPKPGDGVGQDSALNAQQPHARAQHPSHAPLHPTRRADNNNSQGGVFGPSHGDGDGDNDDGDNDNGDDNNDNDNADMSNLTHRRMSIAQEASSSRSSISQSRTPTFPPPPAAGPSRPTPGFSWFSPTEPKDEDGHGSDHSTAQATRSKAKSKRRAVKHLNLTSSPLADDLRPSLDPNNLLPLSATPEIPDASPRTSSSWGTRSYASSAEDEGSPLQTAQLLGTEPEDEYPPMQRQRRAPRKRPWWLALLAKLVQSNSVSPAQEYRRYRERIQAEKRNSVGTRRARYKVLGSTWLAIALNWIVTERWMVVLLFFFTLIFGICLGCTIKYNLDPDYMALPWRQYCTASSPRLYSLPSNVAQPAVSLPGMNPLLALTPEHPNWPYKGYSESPFAADLNTTRIDEFEPTTVFLAIFTYDKGKSRRDLIRQSYNVHARSRTPGTEGVRLRFLMGRPRAELSRAVEKEQAEHNDIVILDIQENMNEGKTHEYFSWAAEHARVPDYEYPSHPRSEASRAQFEAARARGEEPQPILHGEKAPDFVAKADDDAFLMLGEFERHLRVLPKTKTFWGYLVRELFMAGECYAMSLDLAKWIRDNGALDPYTHGKEDKLVSRWLRMHPQADEIVWATEHCWIYDHPKAGTVYSHGYLYPSEVSSVREEQRLGLPIETVEYRSKFARNPDAYSTVSRYGERYRPPVWGLSDNEQVEALVEGSALSQVHRTPRPRRAAVAKLVDGLMGARPTRDERFLGKPHGGTVLIHFIKKNEWFAETVAAMLGD